MSKLFIDALMTYLLASELDDAMLEIGTGSGYQAAAGEQARGWGYADSRCD